MASILYSQKSVLLIWPRLYQYWAACEGGETRLPVFPNKPETRTLPFFDDTTVFLEHAFNINPGNDRADWIGKYGFSKIFRWLLFMIHGTISRHQVKG